MAIYDGYKLSNSTTIPQFEGSAGDDFIKVGQYKQGIYDQAQSSGIKLGGEADEVNSILPQDQPLVEKLRQETQGQLKDIGTRGDWENAMPEIQALGQHFANRSKEIMAPQQALSEYRNKILTEKEKNLTPDQQQGLLAMSVSGYQGLKQNAKGQLIGQFNGITPAKNIDVNEWIDKRLKDVVASKQGDSYEFSKEGDMWITKNGVKTEKIDPKRLQTILQAAQANDPEYSAFKDMQGKIAGFHAASITNPDLLPDKLSDGSPNTLKSDALTASKKYGLPFNRAYSLVVQQTTQDHIDHAVSTYGINKYMENNRTTEHELKTNEFTLKRYDTGAVGPFVVQGPDSKLTNDEKNYDKVVSANQTAAETIQSTQGEINKLQKDLQGNLSPSTKTQKQADLTNAQNRLTGLQSQKNRSEDILNYSKMLTAQNMGYQDYDDFLKKNSKGLDNAISKVYPNGIMTSKGRQVSKQELIEAAADNRIEANLVTGAASTGGGGAPYQTGTTITLKDGTKVPITGLKATQLTNEIGDAFQGSAKNVRTFNDNLKTQHENNVKDFAIQSSNVQIPEDQRKELTVMLKGVKDGIRFSNPGEIASTSAPDNFHVVSLGTAGVGSETKLQVEELDKDGKPTGKYYDATLPNSNISEQMARHMGDSKSPESKQIADYISSGSGARQIMQSIPGNTIPVGKIKNPTDTESDPIDVSIKIIRDPKDKTISYNLVDDGGGILKHTNLVQEAGYWMDEIQGKDTYSNGRKKLRIDRGHTTTQ